MILIYEDPKIKPLIEFNTLKMTDVYKECIFEVNGQPFHGAWTTIRNQKRFNLLIQMILNLPEYYLCSDFTDSMISWDQLPGNIYRIYGSPLRDSDDYLSWMHEKLKGYLFHP